MKIETIEINKINPAVYNPRKDLKPGDTDYEKLKKSILAFDMVEPLVWNKQTGNLAGGHQRLKIMKELGYTEADVSVVDIDETQEKALNIALNKISGEWDLPSLKDLLQELDTGAFDMEITGFDAKEIEDLMNQFHVPEEGLTNDDAVPEDVETVCKKGDLWQLGNHRLLCGDATVITDVERLMGGEKADMVFTDPPYGVGFKYKTYDDVGGEAYEQFCKDWFVLLQSLIEKIIITPGCYNLGMWHRFTEPKHVGCWTRTNSMTHGRVTYFECWEPILFYGDFKKKRGNDIFDFPIGKQPDTGDHSCPKPIALIEDIIQNFSGDKFSVLDVFGGSGSTLIACEKLDRRCYMMEIDEHYCDVIIKRWQDYTGREAVRLDDN